MSLRAFALPAPHRTALQYFDPAEVVAIGPLDASLVMGSEPMRAVYLRGGAVFCLPEGPDLEWLLRARVVGYDVEAPA